MNGIGQRIRSIRGRQSRQAFAQIAGISPSSLVRYETETLLPSASAILAICDYANVSTDWLITGRKRPQEPGELCIEASPVQCLFCGREGNPVIFFIQGPRLNIEADEETICLDVYICEHCTDVCTKVLAEHRIAQNKSASDKKGVTA